MKTIVALCLFLTLLGCANEASSKATGRDELIRAAMGELNRRHIQVPSNCIITIVEWVTVSAIQRPREAHLVRFERPYGAKRVMLYAVAIDKHSGKASDFLDYRGLTGGPKQEKE